jgi:hypothetical protein
VGDQYGSEPAVDENGCEAGDPQRPAATRSDPQRPARCYATPRRSSPGCAGYGDIGLVSPVELEDDYYQQNTAPATVEASVASLH